MISIRLTSDLEKKLNTVAKNENITKSAIIKRALVLYFKDFKQAKSPYEIGKNFFGKYGSGKADSSKNYKRILKTKLSEKHTH